MNESIESIIAGINENGFALAEQVYDQSDILEIAVEVQESLASLTAESSASIRTRSGVVYAARNFLSIFPKVTEFIDRPILKLILNEILGESCGLVRGLYFDKPPQQGWTLPWHKDLTVAVRNTNVKTSEFKNPTFKAGVSHFEAPESILKQMLTLRIHLDGADQENGALMVMPQSHHGKVDSAQPDQNSVTIATQSGDVFMMRPMLTHCSGNSHPEIDRHRRVIHLEFAASQRLPDRVEWNTFLPV